MNRYDYLVMSYDTTDSRELENSLNTWGEHGWELCHLDANRFILKRVKLPSVEKVGNADDV